MKGRLAGAGPSGAAEAFAAAGGRHDPDEQVEIRVELIESADVRRAAAGAVRRGAVPAPEAQGSRRSRKPPKALVEELGPVAGAAAPKIATRLADAGRAFEAERFLEAQRILGPLARRAPGSAAVRELHGLTLYRLGRWAAAAKELEAFRQLTGSTEQHPVLADCYRALRRYDDVEALWDELREASPSAELVAEGRIVVAGSLADRGELGARHRHHRTHRPPHEGAPPPAPATALVRARRPVRAGGRHAPSSSAVRPGALGRPGLRRRPVAPPPALNPRGPVSRGGADPLHRGTLRFRQHGVGVDLEVLEGTFSTAGVDAGTRHLLRWLTAERYQGATTVLDVGCGYGPLGLWLAAANPDRRVVAVDRDARAVEAARLGVGRNGLAGRVEARGGLGYDGLGGERFDLVVCNLPAKVGPAALSHLLLDAAHHTTATGLVAVVVVDRLRAQVEAVLDDPAVEVLDVRPTKAYTAFEYRVAGVPAGSSPDPAFERGVYRRDRRTFTAGRLEWEAEVSWAIGEFDALAHGTEAALQLLSSQPPSGPSPVVVADVGQGHLARALVAGGHAGDVRLADRDLLALRTAAANLAGVTRGAVTCHHAGRLDNATVGGAGLVVVAIPPKEPVAVTAAVLGPALAAGGTAPVVLHGRAADVTRVLELLPRHGVRLAVVDRVRVEGHVAVRGRPRPGRT